MLMFLKCKEESIDVAELEGENQCGKEKKNSNLFGMSRWKCGFAMN